MLGTLEMLEVVLLFLVLFEFIHLLLVGTRVETRIRESVENAWTGTGRLEGITRGMNNWGTTGSGIQAHSSRKGGSL